MRTLVFSILLLAAVTRGDDYVLGPDSQRQAGVPKGSVSQLTFSSSKIYPGTVRDYWIYVPSQYRADKAACVMVFQDGGGMVTETGGWRVPIVLDNLIHKGEMPVTIGLFVNPGVIPANSPTQQSQYYRSFEYDALGDRYARFLVEEILPEVATRYNLSKDPNDHAISGSSSGGIAALNAAWNRPDVFHRVVSFIGSYTNLRGGDGFASLIRKTEPKPLRVFLQDGRNDQDIYGGNWFLGNQEIFSALQYAGYESEFAIGTEGHNSKHGGAILPDALRWVWKGYPQRVTKPEKVIDRGVYSILEPGKDWELLGQGYQLSADSTTDKDGNIYFTDHRHMSINKIDRDGKITVWNAASGGAHGTNFGPDGRLYAGQHDNKRIVAYAPDGTQAVVAEGMQTHHFVVTARNEIYFADAPNHKVWFIDAAGNKRVVSSDLNWPHAVRVSPDQSLLAVNDSNLRSVWSFQIQHDGSLTNGQPFYRLEIPGEASGPEPGGMTFDSEGFLYVATNLGVQVCDPAGRVTAIINPPGNAGTWDVLFGGADMRWLYVTDGDKFYRRLVKRHGVTIGAPVRPPQPRL